MARPVPKRRDMSCPAKPPSPASVTDERGGSGVSWLALLTIICSFVYVYSTNDIYIYMYSVIMRDLSNQKSIHYHEASGIIIFIPKWFVLPDRGSMYQRGTIYQFTLYLAIHLQESGKRRMPKAGDPCQFEARCCVALRCRCEWSCTAWTRAHQQRKRQKKKRN